MTQPASRLITLIMLLQRQPNQKAADLAEKLGISVRSLHRYIAMLDDMGIPVYTERGPHGGFSLVRGYKMPPLIFNPEEATAVYLGTSLVEEMWGSLYHEAAQGALAKLNNVLPDEQQQEIAWARRSLAIANLHRADMDPLVPLLEKLRRAVRELRSVDMSYQGMRNAAPQSRRLDPYALVHRWGWWYVVGYCHLRQEVRSFRVDRIVELTLTAQVFQLPPDFEVRAYLQTETQDQPKLRVRMRFAPEAVHVAQSNRSYWEAVEEQPDGAWVVTFLTIDLNWAVSSVLAYGPSVTVLEPAELVRVVRDSARAIAALYETGGRG
jgi:predicted DNA-binding transcriptional regulator YafY